MALHVGIIGFGRIGAEHARWLGGAAGIRATAVADATPARRAMAEGRGLRAYATVDELLNDASLDVILVATPTAMHFEHAQAALTAGKHVMVEKPITLDLPSAVNLQKRAADVGSVLSVFHNRRWDLDYLTARAAVRSGVFGKVINVESRLGQWSSCVGPAAREYRPGWRNEASYGGGGLYDWGSHFVDQIWRLLYPAKPVRVFAQLRGNVWTKDCDDFARVCIDFDDGTAGMIEINTTTTRPLPRWHIDGTHGSADSPHSPAFDLRTWARLEFMSGIDPHRAPRLIEGVGEESLDETRIWEGFGFAVNGKAPPAVTVESVLPTMALLDAARQSAREGKAIEVGGNVHWVY